MDFSSELRYLGGQMGTVFDAARSLIDRIEARWEDFLLSRDPGFAESLREADEEIRTGRTISLAELDTEDRPLAL